MSCLIQLLLWIPEWWHRNRHDLAHSCCLGQRVQCCERHLSWTNLCDGAWAAVALLPYTCSFAIDFITSRICVYLTSHPHLQCFLSFANCQCRRSKLKKQQGLHRSCLACMCSFCSPDSDWYACIAAVAQCFEFQHSCGTWSCRRWNSRLSLYQTKSGWSGHFKQC